MLALVRVFASATGEEPKVTHTPSSEHLTSRPSKTERQADELPDKESIERIHPDPPSLSGVYLRPGGRGVGQVRTMNLPSSVLRTP